MEAPEAPLRLLVGDELGQIKVVQGLSLAQLTEQSSRPIWCKPSRGQRVGTAATATAPDGTPLLAVGRITGSVDVLHRGDGQLLCSFEVAAEEEVVGVHALTASPAAGEEEAESAAAPIAAGSLLVVTSGGGASLFSPASPDARSWELARGFRTAAKVQCSALDAASGILGVGCEGSDLRLYSVASGEVVYQARGGKPNMVGLVDPAHNTAIAFLERAGESAGSADGDATPSSSAPACQPGTHALPRVLVGTAKHRLRLYDPRIGRRPQSDLVWGKTRVSAIATGGARGADAAWAADGLGQFENLDLKTGRLYGGIRGISGGIRALALHPDGGLIASVGLDRYLRIHDTATRKLLAKIYLKTCLTTVAFCDATDLIPLPEPAAKPSEAEAADVEGVDVEAPFDGAAAAVAAGKPRGLKMKRPAVPDVARPGKMKRPSPAPKPKRPRAPVVSKKPARA